MLIAPLISSEFALDIANQHSDISEVFVCEEGIYKRRVAEQS